MRDITAYELDAVSAGTIVCGESIPVGLIQGIQHEAVSDARKAAILVGTATALLTYSVFPPSMVVAATVSMASMAYTYEYTNTWNVLNYAK